MTKPRGRFWSNVAAVAYKEATIVRHDKALLATVIAQPIMMFLLFGLAMTNKPATCGGWCSTRADDFVRRLVEDIYSTGYFVRRAGGELAEGREELHTGRALAFVVIPASFRRDVERSQPKVQLLVDGAEPLTSARIAGYIGQVAASSDPTAARQAAGRRAAHRAQRAIDIRQRFWFNPTLRDRDFFLAALAGMLLTNLCLSATSLGLVGERENGTYEQMLSLPTSPLELLIGKLVPFVGLSYLVLLFALTAPGLAFGLWPKGSWITLVVVTLPFVLASLSIGVLVSTLARTSAQAVFITVFFILPSFVLSGTMFPTSSCARRARDRRLLPLRWYQIALRRIVARGADLFEVAVPLLVLRPCSW